MNLMRFHNAVWSIQVLTALDHNLIHPEYYEFLTLETYLRDFFHFNDTAAIPQLKFLNPCYPPARNARSWQAPEPPVT